MKYISLVLSVSMLFGCSGNKTENGAIVEQTPNPTANEIKSTQPGREEQRRLKLDSLLSTRGLTVCDVYHWIGNSELEVSRKLEAKYGVAAAMKMVEQRNRDYDAAWLAYRKKHSIPDSLRTYINVFGVTACP